ncbi:MAG: hypothetical protein AAF675_01125 [Pseudomonadota bacterium]
MKTATITTALIALITLTTLGAAPAVLAAETQRERVAENFLEADVNADGALTIGEFRTLIDLNAGDGIGRAAMIKRLGRYDMAFGRIDADRDGLITPEEMQALAERTKG